MASLLALPQRSDAFTAYRPSKNAHVDFLTSDAAGPSRDAARDVKVIKLTPRASAGIKSPKEELQPVLASIGPILRGEKTILSYHNLSAACHRLVLPPSNLGAELYSCIQGELKSSVDALVRSWRGAIMAREAKFLDRFIAEWRQWESRVDLLGAIVVYLDRIYANDGRLTVKQLGIRTFREGVWGQDILRGKIRDDILAWATAEREAAVSNRTSDRLGLNIPTPASADSQLRPTIASVVALAKLLDTFDTLSAPYVSLANEHYSENAETSIKSVESGEMTSAGYVTWALDKAAEEHERATTCLDEAVAEQVVNVVRVQSGYKMSKRIVRRALDDAMDQSDSAALGRLYQFTVDVDVFGEFVESLQMHIEERLRKVISDPANDPEMIEQTLKLKRFADRSVAGLFADNSPPVETDERAGILYRAQRKSELEDAIRKGCRAGLGSRENAPAEWIAKHLDAAMRKGQGKGTEAEFNALLDEIIALIGFTRDKDVFKAFYSTQLAKRLLLNKSASDDMERNMIIKLQREMGEEFTSGDVMMKDLQLSETLVKSYQTARIKNPDEYADASNLTANVLTESAWPAYPQLKDGWNFKLTPELQSSIDAFTVWYGTQHRNRQLSWRPQLGTVTLSARFDSGKYEVGVSLFQAVVLLHFNDYTTLDFNEIQARTGIESKELVRVLQSLSMGRKGTRVLLKKPAGKEVNPTDQFIWNKGFTSDRIKFRINQIQQDMSAEESKKTNEQVAIDRVSVLEATIVRIMKGRKKMTLQLLIDAVVSDVSKRFPPDVKEMKKRVESLIEREFLMRDEDDRNLLHYLA